MFFQTVRSVSLGIAAISSSFAAAAESVHGIAMYGDPALPPDFVSLPYSNPDSPKGGRVVFGNTGGFDSLNPFVQKGTSPWQLRFWGYESLMTRSRDEPFTLYGLLAESVRTAPDRSWVEFTMNPAARFSDGTPVTVEDVIWSYETLGTQGHQRYRGFHEVIESIKQIGPRGVRITFNSDNRELALIAGLRPILQKAQWDGKDFKASTLSNIPIGSGAYVVTDFEAGRYVSLTRNPDYWARDLPIRRGTQNFDELRIEFYGDQTVLFESFKAGELSVIREFNAEKWQSLFNFPAVKRGDIVKSEFSHKRPSGMTGLVMNSRRAMFADWRVREALLLAFNFEFINDTMTGGAQPRITSYFSNSELAMLPGPATGQVRALLEPFAQQLLPGALDGYALPGSDGTARNRKNLRRAGALLDDAGWTVQNGQRANTKGQPFQFTVLLRQGDGGTQSIVDIFTRALQRLGIAITVDTVDDAQYFARLNSYDFDMTRYRVALSLSPGTEQRLYFGSKGVETPNTRNLMGIGSPAVDALIDTMLSSQSREDFTATVRALDRVLISGRYVIPIWQFDIGRIAHVKQMRHPANIPIYGDGLWFMPEVWWYQDQ
ncbi:MAG: peptide/nickel transport system substrate-binding protein [Paracoccaceae bacterium]|jgi:peptide/nickel transport system substrate-binding protein